MEISPEKKYAITKTFVCAGEFNHYMECMEEFEIKDSLDFLEYALVYGRFNILNHMISREFYKNALADPTYNPFDLENIEDIDVRNDLHNGSYWGNDERERAIRNSRGINHKLAIECIEKFEKKLNHSNIQNWLSIETSYFPNTYFASPSLLIRNLFQSSGIELTIKNVIEFVESLELKLNIFKILKSIFKKEELIEQLKK